MSRLATIAAVSLLLGITFAHFSTVYLGYPMRPWLHLAGAHQ